MKAEDIKIKSPKVQAIYDGILKELDGSNISYRYENGDINPTPIAPRLVQACGNWQGPRDEEYWELVDLTVKFASESFVDVTGIKPAPSTYAEVADYNKYWRNHATACKVPREQARPVLMTLRDALAYQDGVKP